MLDTLSLPLALPTRFHKLSHSLLSALGGADNCWSCFGRSVLENKNSSVPPFLELWGSRCEFNPVDSIFELDPTLGCSQPGCSQILREIVWNPIHPRLPGDQNASGVILVPPVSPKLLRNPWGHQRVIRSSRAVGPKEDCSETLFVDFLRDQSFRPTSVLRAKLEQSS